MKNRESCEELKINRQVKDKVRQGFKTILNRKWTRIWDWGFKTLRLRVAAGDTPLNLKWI